MIRARRRVENSCLEFSANECNGCPWLNSRRGDSFILSFSEVMDGKGIRSARLQKETNRKEEKKMSGGVVH